MPDESEHLDAQKLKRYARHVFGLMSGATASAMIYLGDRMGLYRALRDGGPATSAELAERTGLHERWLREWLYAQGAAGILEHLGGERFGMTPEAVALLANEDHPAFGAGMFSQLPQLMGVLERLPESFRTGLGLPYDAFGPEGARGVERGFAPWYRNLLVPMALPRLDGVLAKLDAGVQVADVGCGSGVALTELGRRFPRSHFHGYEISAHALERAEARRREAGLANVSFHDSRVDPLPEDARFQLVTTFDCLHDMTDPAATMRAIRGAIAADGVWLIAEVKAKPSYQRNVDENPMAAMMYGISVLSCMSSSLSEPGGAGLGTLGLSEERAREMTRAAGFTRFTPLDFGHPVNAFYEVRP
ncbi:MAG: methyltransferase domain-containing protein [Deltaproteobacteria bacterium]|nr:MAG: methyltransferase domain-containing protein [Deltaproteobacteria bacterium]